MFEFLKIVHLLALAIGLGVGTANLSLGKRMPTFSDETKASIGPIRVLFARIGFSAIAVLWITGLALYYLRYGAGELGTWFHVKLALAVLLIAAAAWVQWLLWQAKNSGKPPPAATMARLAHAIPSLAVLTVIAAVLAFT